MASFGFEAPTFSSIFFVPYIYVSTRTFWRQPAFGKALCLGGGGGLCTCAIFFKPRFGHTQPEDFKNQPKKKFFKPRFGSYPA